MLAEGILFLAIQSLLRNAGFEDGVAGWTQATYGATPEIVLDKSAKHGGARALRISSASPSDTALAQDLEVRPNRFYRFSGWVRTKALDPKGAPVFGTIQAQSSEGAILASGANTSGDSDWRRVAASFVSPASGRVHVALFFCGWGKGTGTVWFDDLRFEEIDPGNIPVKITEKPLCPGRISPMQYGQFIEYLCDLVPSMWAEKLYDGSFEGLSPYKFEFIKETDFKEKPWYPFGQVDREKVSSDPANKMSGDLGKSIEIDGDSPAEAGIAQDGISLVEGGTCSFTVWVKGSGKSTMTVRLLTNERPALRFKGPRFGEGGPLPEDDSWSHRTVPVTNDWEKVSLQFTPTRSTDRATLAITFRGPGRFWLDNASLMPLDTIGGWRKDVVEALRQLRPSVIRVGGSVLDDPNLGTFEWKDTVGDPDKRKPFRAWGGLQPTGPGMEEVVQLIRAANAEPLICIRYEGKNPKDAADEVEYFNGDVSTPMGALRAKNGHPEAYHIRYWQIGNERWGADYWKAVPEFAKAILAVDPKAQLLTSFPSPDLIRLAAPYVRFVSPHQYNVHDLAGTKGELDQVRQMIGAYAGGRDIKVAVTEWNTTAGDAGPKRAGLWNLANALACARYHNLLHRNADLVEIANRSNLANSFCSGIIQTSRSAMFLTPTYYAQCLYANLAGTRPLKIESDLPADAAPDMSATLSEDGKTLTLFAVNDSLAQIARPIDLSSFHLANGGCDVYTLGDSQHAGEPSVSNSFTDPNRVQAVHRSVAVESRFNYTFPPLSLTVLRWHVTP